MCGTSETSPLKTKFIISINTWIIYLFPSIVIWLTKQLLSHLMGESHVCFSALYQILSCHQNRKKLPFLSRYFIPQVSNLTTLYKTKIMFSTWYSMLLGFNQSLSWNETIQSKKKKDGWFVDDTFLDITPHPPWYTWYTQPTTLSLSVNLR